MKLTKQPLSCNLPFIPVHTIGMDLGDRVHHYCVLDHVTGDIIKEGTVPNDRLALKGFLFKHKKSRVIMECGMQSPWISRYLTKLRAEVIVANPRKVKAIYGAERKSDKRDAVMLARIGRVDTNLLSPIIHGSEEAQKEMLAIKMRDALVRQRVSLINTIRFTLKSLGLRVRSTDTRSFHRKAYKDIPKEYHHVFSPLLSLLKSYTDQIKDYQKQFDTIALKHEVAQRLMKIRGVGSITALTFIHKIEDPKRFQKARDVGAYLGLVPKRDQSGDTDKQLRISKAGDHYLRRLLISAAQYIMGPFGEDCDLRTFGEKLAASGGARAKKRAVVAVARKLTTLMLTLWKKAETPYEANYLKAA